MIQFNLLPDVKINYLKIRRQKRIVILASMLASAIFLLIVLLVSGYVYGIQGSQLSTVNKNISSLNESINSKNRQVDDFNKVLTVQAQLRSLDSLHAQKPLSSRLFIYLSQLTPAQTPLSSLTVSMSEESAMQLQGSTDTLESVNRFVDTLKFTMYKDDENQSSSPVFSNVVLSSFSRDKAGASFGVTMNFDPIIFSTEFSPEQFYVPQNKVTTRSEIGRPIFVTSSEAANNAPETKDEP